MNFMSQSPSLLGNLNERQCEAANTLTGPLLILAGAGSGKTRILTFRIANLIESGTALPGEIFAVTFTNKAAREMRERVQRLLATRGIPSDDLWITTFHSAGAKILREHGHRVGLAPGFTIFDDSDQLSLIKECMHRLEISDKFVSPKNAMWRINELKNDGIDPREFSPKLYNFVDAKLAPLFKLYEEQLIQNNAADFGDLLFKTYQLFNNNADLLEAFQDRYRQILVDEYQDTNAVQYRLLKLLASRFKNLCVVGDEDQSIYAWRGADIRNILEFEKDYPEAKVVKLEENYRSSAHIIRAASKVIANNTQRKEKTLYTSNADGDQVEVNIVENDFDEARLVTRKIRSQLDQGVALNEIAILYRTHAQSRLLEDSLRYERINYRIFGGVKFYERAEIKDALAYLRLVANPRDDISLYRIINVPTRGIGRQSIDAIRTVAAKEGIPGLDAASLLARGELGDLGPGPRRKIHAFLEIYAKLASKLSEYSVQDFYSYVLEESGYLQALNQENTVEAQARLENLKELASAVRDYEERAESPSVAGFLEEVALVTDMDKADDNAPALTMMTLHSAKGLEFNTVYLVGLEEGLFPSIKGEQLGAEDPETIEEERRLCYVGMTRARKNLYMSSARMRRVFGITQIRRQSRFIDELPQSEIILNNHAPKNRTPSSSPSFWRQRASSSFDSDFNQDFGELPSFNSTQKATKSDSTLSSFFDEGPVNDDYAVGTKVRHPDYGDGTVVAREGQAAGLKVSVRFVRAGTKKFIAKYAPLQVMR